MKILGNLSLCFALLLLIYPLIPKRPARRASNWRLNFGPLGSLCALLLWLMPQFLRRMLASLAMWNLLALALVVAIASGGLDWTGINRVAQCLLAGAACFSMAEISVLIGLSYKDPDFQIPDVVRVISPWAAWVLPLVVAGFALLALNPLLATPLSPWAYRLPLLGAFALALPIGAILFRRWITPPVVEVTPGQ